MKTATRLSTSLAPLRGFGRVRLSFSKGAIFSLAIIVLWASTTAILSLRSPKYLGALIAIGGLVTLFLMLKDKYSFLVFAAGFVMPFHVQVILMERSRALLVVTGMLIVIVALAIVAIMTGVWSTRRIRVVPQITVPAAAYVCAGLLSLINTSDRTVTLISLVPSLEMVVLLLVLVNAVRTPDELLTFLRGMFSAFALECGIYVLQNVLGYSFDVVGNVIAEGATDIEEGRLGYMRGTFGTAHLAGTYFAAWTLLLIGLYLSARRLKIIVSPLLGVLMGGACLILAAKRAPMIGFAIGLVTLVVMLPRIAPGAIRKLVGAGAAICLSLVILLPIFLLRAEANHEGALEERLNLNKVAWEMYDAHPLIGVGLGTYNSVKRQYLPDDWSGWLYEVHNQYLLTLAETGAIGLATSVLLYGLMLYSAWRGVKVIERAFRPAQAAIIGALLVVFWEMFWNMWYGRNCQYLLWFLAAMAFILPEALPSRRKGPEGGDVVPG